MNSAAEGIKVIQVAVLLLSLNQLSLPLQTCALSLGHTFSLFGHTPPSLSALSIS